MIGFNALGRMGRLGNQMFQYAALKGLARNIGADITIPYYPDAVDDGIGNMLRTELFDSFDLRVNIGLLNNGHAPVLQERQFHFDDELFRMCPDHVSLQGYFQTEKYFKHIENEIREDFTFKDDYLKPCKEYIDSIETPPIFLHIRQADNIGREEFHPILPISFFEDSLKNWSEDTPCFVFTDDIDWCKSQEFFQQDRFLFNDNVERYDYTCMDGLGNMQHSLLPQVDLCLMSLCSGGIIANSSFSWWGAWLQNDRGKVVAPDPKKWFGTSMTHLDTSDIVPDRWTIQEWSK